MVEVQTGGYLGEDDIVRFDDTYGRCPSLKARGGDALPLPDAAVASVPVVAAMPVAAPKLAPAP